MALVKGLDASANCTLAAKKIAAAGYSFVGRYYAHKGKKRLLASEAQALCAEGLKLVAVWEESPTNPTYFSLARGIDDGTSAYHYALLIGQPAGSAIYFAVDFDASAIALSGAISDYFRGIAQGFGAIAQGSPVAYDIGVYGSGRTCSTITGHSLAKLSWLAQSTGWAGYATYSNWSIKQGATTTPPALGIEIDPDSAQGAFGAFQVVT